MKFDPIHVKSKRKDLVKRIKLPKEMSVELAELIGIHFGDGSMSQTHNNKYRLTYTCNSLEKQYAKHIANLFKQLFDVSIKIKENKKKNCVDMYFYSKTLCAFFNTRLGIPYSPKTDLRIPEIVLSNNNYLAAFIRGLFDTDGCITIQKSGKYSYYLLKISTKHKTLADDISKALNILEIPAFISTKSHKTSVGFDVTVRNKNVTKFFKIVGSNNHKKRKKWGH